MSDTSAVPLNEVVHVLRLARDGWPDGCEWTTDGFASAAWNGFLAGSGEESVTLTGAGEAFLAKVGGLYPEVSR